MKSKAKAQRRRAPNLVLLMEKRPQLRLLRTRGGFRLAKLLLSAAALAVLLAPPSRAISDAAGTSGSAFMKLGLGSPRALALGRAYVALADGEDAMVWNPAGLARAGTRELGFGIMSWVQDYTGQYIGYAHPLGRTVVGVNVAHLETGNFDVRDANGLPLDNSTTLYRTGFATLSFARSFFLERVFLGVSGKAIYEDLAGISSTNFAGDVGILIRPNPRLAFGAALQNVLNDPARVVQTQRLGAAFSPSDFVTFTVESSKDSDTDQRFGGGIEFTLSQELLQVGECDLRLGYYSADNYGQGFDSSLKRFGIDLSRASGISYGIGLSSTRLLGYGVAFDYAFVPMGALGVANTFAFKFTF
jgi:hypothetical protein